VVPVLRSSLEVSQLAPVLRLSCAPPVVSIPVLVSCFCCCCSIPAPVLSCRLLLLQFRTPTSLVRVVPRALLESINQSRARAFSSAATTASRHASPQPFIARLRRCPLSERACATLVIRAADDRDFPIALPPQPHEPLDRFAASLSRHAVAELRRA
jgi:hypothetical protein